MFSEMVILDGDGNIVVDADPSTGKLSISSIPVRHVYVVDQEESGHWETVAEYENGGRDVEWIVDSDEVGHWETVNDGGELIEYFNGSICESWPKESVVPDVWEYLLYTPYTSDEVASISFERRRDERNAESDKQVAIAARMIVRSSKLTDADALSVSMLHSKWNPSETCDVGDVRRFGGRLWRLEKESLGLDIDMGEPAPWRMISRDEEPKEWFKPVAGLFHGYMKGDRVSHNGTDWESVYCGLNAFEPGEEAGRGKWKEVM